MLNIHNQVKRNTRNLKNKSIMKIWKLLRLSSVIIHEKFKLWFTLQGMSKECPISDNEIKNFIMLKNVKFNYD